MITTNTHEASEAMRQIMKRSHLSPQAGYSIGVSRSYYTLRPKKEDSHHV